MQRYLSGEKKDLVSFTLVVYMGCMTEILFFLSWSHYMLGSVIRLIYFFIADVVSR